MVKQFISQVARLTAILGLALMGYLPALMGPTTTASASIDTTPALKFGIITDTHYSAANPGILNGVAEFVSAMSTFGADFYIENGDFSTNGIASEYQALEPVFDNSSIPSYHVVGNHDNLTVKYANTDMLGGPDGYYSFDKNGYHIIVLFNADDRTGVWQLGATQTAWLQADLAASTLPEIVFSHVPLLQNWSNWKYPGIAAQDASTVRAILEADGGVIAAFSGHTHPYANEDWAETWNGIRYFNISSLFEDFTTPSNYAKVTIYSNGGIVIQGSGAHQGNYGVAPDGTWNASWAYRQVLSFNASSTTTDTYNFPARVHLTGANFNFTQAETNGEDIRFTDSNGVQLPHEIESWDSVGQDAVVWVRAPVVRQAGAYSDYVYMHWGNPVAPDGQDAQRVWGDYIPIDSAGATTNYTVSTGGNLTLDTSVYHGGSASVSNNVSSPSAATSYNTTYVFKNPAGTITSHDLSRDGQFLSVWVRVSRASTAFTTARLYIVDEFSRLSYWPVTFSAGAWKELKVRVASGTGSAVDTIIRQISLRLVAADTTGFVVNLDDLETRWGALEVLHFTSNATDSSRYVNSGTGVASPVYAGGNVTLNGTNQTITQPQFVDGVGAIELRAQSISFSSESDVVGEMSVGTPRDSFRLSLEGSNGQSNFGWSTNGTDNFVSGIMAPTGSWANIQGVWNTTTPVTQVWRNATSVGTIAAPSSIYSPAYTVSYGSRNGASVSKYWHGALDEARVWPTTLSADWAKLGNEGWADTLLYFGPTNYGPAVTTDAATSVSFSSSGSAVFNGNVTTLGGAPNNVTAYFEYGPNLDHTTSRQTLTGTGVFNATVTDISAAIGWGTIPIRAVAQVGNAYSYGSQVTIDLNRLGQFPGMGSAIQVTPIILYVLAVCLAAFFIFRGTRPMREGEALEMGHYVSMFFGLVFLSVVIGFFPIVLAALENMRLGAW